MADKNIGALPQAPNLDDDSLMVVEQQGTAMKMTGAQFKEFGKLGVMQDVQGLVDDAKDAADKAAGAVSSVVDMTVEASTLDSGMPATVTKTIKQGKVNLSFGLPRGAKGVPGPEGKEGPRGPQGVPGTGLKILGYYDTKEDLEAAVTNPKAGDAYGVGAEAPYDIYIFDGVANAWKNNGPMSGGGGGGVVPENVVTSEGGASFEYGAEAGAAPHVITFTNEEEPPLTAEDVNYSDTQTVKDAIDGLKASVSDGKALIASAITDKGVDTAQDATFSQLAENIGQITTGTDTSDATAGAGDILSPKTAYTASGKVTGRIPSLGAQTITPGTSSKSISSGQYLSGPQTIQGDPNLTSANIKKGVSIFGVQGAVESTFKATLTVTVDVGAEVRATCGSKTITALSTTGTVVMELPSEGTWSITAARGMMQYTTEIITVASSFNVALKPSNHVEYFIEATSLSEARGGLSGASVGNYALFVGGNTTNIYGTATDAYNADLVRSSPSAIGKSEEGMASVAIGNYALFVGVNGVYAYNANLSLSNPSALSVQRSYSAAATVGNYALVGGGYNFDSSSYSAVVDAYNTNLTRTTVSTPLVQARSRPGATSTENHALFGGGLMSSGQSAVVDAYDENLTRSTPSPLGAASSGVRATKSGSYALFCTYSGMNAYDITLTRSAIAALSPRRSNLSAVSLNGFALFGGGNNGQKTENLEEVLAFNSTVNVYDLALSRSTTGPLSEARGYLAASSIGDYALFAGGFKKVALNSNGSIKRREATGTVDVYRYV